MSKINEYPVLDKEAEREMLIKAQNGDKQAFDYLVLSNIGLVVDIAKKYQGRGIELDDLVQIGNMELMHAIQKHDTTMDIKLSSYATWWIRQYVMRNIQIYSRTIRTPCHVYQKNFKLMADIKNLEQELEYEPSETEILEALNITKKQYKAYREDVKDTVSLSKVYSDNGTQWIEMLADDSEDMAINLQLKEIADTIKTILNEREWLIFSMHVGLDGHIATYSEISRGIGVSKQRVQQIWLNVLGKLRRNSKIKMFKAS